MTQIKAGSLGFAGAADSDRTRWMNSFRHLLDGLDSPIQVLIEAIPGSGTQSSAHPSPIDFDEMRGADLAFVDQVSQSPSAHRFETRLITSEAQSKRLEAALREIDVPFDVPVPNIESCFGKELANRFQHPGGHSRTWYVERLPGTDLEAGWLFKLIPPGLNVRLAWHVTPLPVAWIVEYLQRQLINMRATRLINHDAGSPDPLLAGALPNAEDLQRRLASSQDKAFHVAVYVTLTTATLNELKAGTIRVESAARAVLCQLQPCIFRMFDGYLATQPVGVDRLERKRVLDTSALVTFFPWLEPDLVQPGGFVIGRNLMTGTPVLVDPFDQRDVLLVGEAPAGEGLGVDLDVAFLGHRRSYSPAASSGRPAWVTASSSCFFSSRRRISDSVSRSVTPGM